MSTRLHRALLASLPLLACACSSTDSIPEERLQPLAELARKVDREELMTHVHELAEIRSTDTPLACTPVQAERVPARCHLTQSGVRSLLQSRFESLGLQVQLQPSEQLGAELVNVVADLPGTTRPEELILVGAHFDSFYQGADDNASGVAALLELARVLSQYRFERTIRFVGFDMEELGLVGSTHYVNALGNEHLEAAIIFDCIGYYDSTPGSQRTMPGLPSPGTGDFLAVIGNDTSSPLAAELRELNTRLGLAKTVTLLGPGDGASPLTGDLLRSDHTPFWLTGGKALFLTDTANFRNPNYHQATDLPETLSPEPFSQAVRLSAVGLAWWAGGPQ
ncbi:MAG: M28 family metallopeptidase [Archangium sp.]